MPSSTNVVYITSVAKKNNNVNLKVNLHLNVSACSNICDLQEAMAIGR